MECPRCKKELSIPSRAYINLQAYHQDGGRVLVASDCCGYGVWLNMRQVFTVEPYSGDKIEDDWGIKIKNE